MSGKKGWHSSTDGWRQTAPPPHTTRTTRTVLGPDGFAAGKNARASLGEEPLHQYEHCRAHGDDVGEVGVEEGEALAGAVAVHEGAVGLVIPFFYKKLIFGGKLWDME